MGRLFVEHLPDGRVYACKSCLATNPCQIVHLAPVADLISKVGLSISDPSPCSKSLLT